MVKYISVMSGGNTSRYINKRLLSYKSKGILYDQSSWTPYVTPVLICRQTVFTNPEAYNCTRRLCMLDFKPVARWERPGWCIKQAPCRRFAKAGVEELCDPVQRAILNIISMNINYHWWIPTAFFQNLIERLDRRVERQTYILMLVVLV